ncbi:unnamed protein product, partial [Ectocarpus sp. 4 AP-2014]
GFAAVSVPLFPIHPRENRLQSWSQAWRKPRFNDENPGPASFQASPCHSRPASVSSRGRRRATERGRTRGIRGGVNRVGGRRRLGVRANRRRRRRCFGRRGGGGR